MSEPLDIVVRQDGARGVQDAIEGVGKSAKTTADHVEFMKKALEFAGITLSIASFVALSQEGIAISNVLKNATESLTEFNAALAATQETARQTGASTHTLAELYDTLATAGRDFHATQDQTSTIVDTVAKAFAAEGKSVEEASGAIKGLSRALLTGQADARGFMTIINSSNLLAETMAAQFAETGGSVGKFVQMIKDGKISSEDFFKALLQSSQTVQSAFGNSSRTLAQAFGSLHASLVALVTDSENATGLMGSLASGIIFVSEHLNALIPIVVAFGVAWVAAMVRSSLATGALREAVNLLNLAMKANPFVLILSLLATLAVSLYEAYRHWATFAEIVDRTAVGLGFMDKATADANKAVRDHAIAANAASEAQSKLAATGATAAASLNVLKREADGSAAAVNSYGEAITQVAVKHLSFAERVKASVEALGGSYDDLTRGVVDTSAATVHFGDSINSTSVSMGRAQSAAASYTGQLRNLYDVMKNISDVTFDSNGIGGGNFGGKATINVGSPQDILQWLKEGKLTGNYLVDTSNANMVGFVGNIWLENYKQGLALYWEEMRKNQASQAAGSAATSASSLASPTVSQQSINNNRSFQIPVTIITPNPTAFGASGAQIQRMIAASINHALDQT